MFLCCGTIGKWRIGWDICGRSYSYFKSMSPKMVNLWTKFTPSPDTPITCYQRGKSRLRAKEAPITHSLILSIRPPRMLTPCIARIMNGRDRPSYPSLFADMHWFLPPNQVLLKRRYPCVLRHEENEVFSANAHLSPPTQSLLNGSGKSSLPTLLLLTVAGNAASSTDSDC